jgi:hypothetical protein
VIELRIEEGLAVLALAAGTANAIDRPLPAAMTRAVAGGARALISSMVVTGMGRSVQVLTVIVALLEQASAGALDQLGGA